CCYSSIRLPPYFPTRRSSDLQCIQALGQTDITDVGNLQAIRRTFHPRQTFKPAELDPVTYQQRGRSFSTNLLDIRQLGAIRHRRSEEHTSELQSRENLVCRLL